MSIASQQTTSAPTAPQADIPEEYTRGQVDEQPLSPVDENKGKLEKLLSGRPQEKDLVDVSICHVYDAGYYTVSAYAALSVRRKTS